MPGYKRVRTGSKGMRKRFKKTVYRRKSFMARNVSRIARAVVLKASETKRKQVSLGKFELFHNKDSFRYHLNLPGSMPSKGDDDNQRNGDTIIGRGWKVKMTLANKGDRPNVTYRITCVARQSTAVPVYADVYKNTSGNILLDDVDKDKNTVLYDRTYKPNKGMVGTTESGLREYLVPYKFWIPRKKMMKFDSATNDVNDRQIWLFVMAYDAFGTLITDNIAYAQLWTEFVYKDP